MGSLFSYVDWRVRPSLLFEKSDDFPRHFFDVITNGFGAMPSYAQQVPVNDRWAIIAYVRALQLSQHATIDDVPTDLRGSLH